MRLCLSALLLVVASSVAVPVAAQTDQELARADAETVRLPPSSFKDLPQNIQEDLERRGCTVPQAFGQKEPHNVIRGRFITKNQWDIAVLCSKERVSSVLVFRDSRTRKVDELAVMADAAFLVAHGGTGPLRFARVLSVSEPDYIRERNGRYAGPKPKFDHEGIDDLIMENGSVIWYQVNSDWVRLRGQPSPQPQ